MGGTGQRDNSDNWTGLLNGEACGEAVGVTTIEEEEEEDWESSEDDSKSAQEATAQAGG